MNFASSGLVSQPLITDINMSRTGNFYFIANLCLSTELCMRMEYRMVFFLYHRVFEIYSCPFQRFSVT